MRTSLDIQLPPLSELTAQALLDYRQGERQGQATRGQLAVQAKGSAWRLHLHENDSLALALALPPLSGKRLEAAVRCAVQGLVLGDAGQVHVAHGPRQPDGQVAVAWLGQPELARLQAWLQAERVRLEGVFAQPAEDLPAPNLAAGLRGPTKALGWRPVLAIWGVAATIWCLGLNLYAAHLASTGEQLRTRMVSQVRQAFPQLPVVLNPLQQARQQLQGGQGAAASGLAALLDAAGQSMPFLVGNVAAMNFEEGVLRISPLADGGKAPADSSWQADLAARGIEAGVDAQGWTLRVAGQQQEALAHAD
jgi:general secretion pathway protein L